MSNYYDLDLDAARREAQAPDGVKVTFKGTEFIVPAELPLDVFTPFFSDELNLGGLLASALASDDDTPTAKVLTNLLFEQPRLPVVVYQAAVKALESLLGADEWARFRELRPSVQDLTRLVRGLFRLYGTNLGEAFASAESSTTDGPTQNPTSNSTSDSTSDASGGAQESATGSSASAA